MFAFSGLLRTPDDELSNHHLVDHALSLAGVGSPKVCFVPTAVGDAAEAVASKRRDFAERHPEVEFSVLTLFASPTCRTCGGTCSPRTCCSSRAAAS